MPVEKPSYQLTLKLDLPAPDEEGNNSADARLKAEAAKKALESMYGKTGAPKWLDEYLQLKEGGWPWRVSAYIAWASVPKMSREPKTQEELARLYMGLTSDRAIATWRQKNPAIDEMVETLQSAPLFRHRAEIFTALIISAVKPDYRNHNDRKLALELTGDYVPRSKLDASLLRRGLKVDDLAEMSDADLQELASALKEREPDDNAEA